MTHTVRRKSDRYTGAARTHRAAAAIIAAMVTACVVTIDGKEVLHNK